MAANALAFILFLACYGFASSSKSGGNSSWIMANTRLPVPTCPAHCLTLLLPDRNVAFLACKLDVPEQQWVYNGPKKTIRSVSEQNSCLQADTSIRVAPCVLGRVHQQWNIDEHRATVSTAAAPAMYLAMQMQQASSSSVAMLVPNATVAQGDPNRIMSLVPHGRPLSSSLSMLDARWSAADNVIVNGGFELSSYATNSSSRIELGPSDTFGACAWNVVSGKVELIGNEARSTPQGQLSIRLNGSVSQLVPASAGGYYVLSILVSGCQQNGLRVFLAPSSTPLLDLVLPPDGSGRWSTRTFAFQAKDANLNVTFQSMPGGTCGPFLDDVRIVEFSGSSNKPMLSSGAMAGVIAGASLAAFLAGGLCVAVTLFSVYHHSKSSSVHSRSTFGTTSDSLGLVLSPDERSRVPTFAGVRILSFSRVEKATHAFSAVIGKGHLGYVYLADFQDGTRGAVKRVLRMFQLTETEFLDAVKTLGGVLHPNIVKLIAFSSDHGEQILVFEYMPGGTLYDRLHGSSSRKACLPWNTRLKIALDVASALEYLHHVANPRIVHQRVKSRNVFLTKDCKAKLADCGAWSRQQQPQSGSFSFPDMNITDKTDVYNFGLLLLELVTGLKSQDCMVLLNDRGNGSTALVLDPELGAVALRGVDNVAEVIRACTEDEAEDRPNMSEVAEVLRQCVLDTQAETTPETRSRPNSPVTPTTTRS